MDLTSDAYEVDPAERVRVDDGRFVNADALVALFGRLGVTWVHQPVWSGPAPFLEHLVHELAHAIQLWPRGARWIEAHDHLTDVVAAALDEINIPDTAECRRALVQEVRCFVVEKHVFAALGVPYEDEVAWEAAAVQVHGLGVEVHEEWEKFVETKKAREAAAWVVRLLRRAGVVRKG